MLFAAVLMAGAEKKVIGIRGQAERIIPETVKFFVHNVN
jgi:hypothetical protein